MSFYTYVPIYTDIYIDKMGVDKMGVDKMGVDKMGVNHNTWWACYFSRVLVFSKAQRMILLQCSH